MRFFCVRFFLGIFLLNLFLAPASYALAADLNWSAATTLSLSGVTFTTLTIASGSAATSLTVDTTTFTVTVPSGSTFTVSASSSITFSNNASLQSTCAASTSSIAIAGPKTDVIVTPTNTPCSSPRAIDSSPPQPPREVKITSEEGKITLTWKDPTESDFANVVILRNSGGTSPISGSPYTLAAKGEEKFVDTDVKEGERYQYHVRSQDSTGNIDLNEEKYTITVVAVKKTEPSSPVTPEKKEEAPSSAKASEGKKEEVKKEEVKKEPEKKAVVVEEKTNGVITEAAKPIVAARSTTAIAEAVGKIAEPEREKEIRKEEKIAAVIASAKGTTEIAAVGFIVYGTAETEKLGEGERAGALNSYKGAYGKLPATEAEWQDALRIAGGALPEQASLAAEQRAIVSFNRIYKRAPEISYDKSKSILAAEDSDDRTALLLAAYGIRPEARDLSAEADVIGNFIALFGKKPVSAQDWDLVRMMAYTIPP